MGRRKKNEDPNVFEKNKRVPRTFSIPKYINDEMDNCKNPSGIVTKILEENITRIGNLTIDDAVKAREMEIKKMAKKAMEETYDEMRPRYQEIVKNVLDAYSYKV